MATGKRRLSSTSHDSTRSSGSQSVASLTAKFRPDGHQRKSVAQSHKFLASKRRANDRLRRLPKKKLKSDAQVRSKKFQQQRQQQQQHKPDKKQTDRPAREKVVPDYDQEEDEYEEDEEEEEEDPLIAIVRRQRAAFSARAAAGRPSIRDAPPAPPPLEAPKLSGASTADIARAMQASKKLREWKSLARKSVCRVGRQWVACRREKINMARKASKECARLFRQRVVASQKATKDAVVRGHRLARELTTHWRASVSHLANNNSTPLTINGLQMPSDTSLIQCFERHGNAKPENTVDLPISESAAAIRRRAERAATEQRRADLELLEARRQQRKLNFLITQTELYTHFMARKMDPSVQAKPAEECETRNDPSAGSTAVELDTQRILRRLDESDEELGTESTVVEGQGLTETDVSMDVDNPAQQSGPSSKKTASSSIAVAARAAAYRLGVTAEEEFDVGHLKSRAVSKVQVAVSQEHNRILQFQPVQTQDSGEPTNIVSENNATTSSDLQVKAPKIFKGQLKEYQLKGLNWLLGLFDQGINGILADEMGLGKTVQTIAFLGHLAERYGLWGPFLIVAPASTLHNWTQEFAKFMPKFRLVPYWGSPAERKVLRRFWSSTRPPNSLHTPDGDEDATKMPRGAFAGTLEAEMHVVVTSYQIVLQDAKFIQKTAWSYIVLDEAHAIKNTSREYTPIDYSVLPSIAHYLHHSLRWRILLSFKCRNRLLLTGTPIQNTMQELWALLHFIMPTLFDSHDEFANWFSRDIESQATATAAAGSSGSGHASASFSTTKLNENQLSRLHLILKPFMLRRTKVEVEHEIASKTEVIRYCPLSQRQQLLYARLKKKIRLEDLSTMVIAAGSGPSGGGAPSNGNSASGAAATGDTSSSGNGGVGNTEGVLRVSSVAATQLVNLVMQLRKVCNHPDLWAHRETQFTCSTGAIQPRRGCGDGKLYGQKAGCFEVPKLLLINNLVPGVDGSHQSASDRFHVPINSRRFGEHCDGGTRALIDRMFNLFHANHIHADLWHHDAEEPDLGYSTAIDPTRIDTQSRETVLKCFSFMRIMDLTPADLVQAVYSTGTSLLSDVHRANRNDLIVLRHLIGDDSASGDLKQSFVLHPLAPFSLERVRQSPSLAQLWLWNLDAHTGQWEANLQVSETQPTRNNAVNLSWETAVYPTNPKSLSLRFVSKPVPLSTRVSDSGKLVVLDTLLNELKPVGHRVLIYSQMTRMIDILEEFMICRKHAYLRLDGSSRLCDRRDMVAQWQSNPRWFVFLLSTRAGGLGINLTAADTVIFYDSDWNPTVDQQAMDRAHRLGQTKPVTVYRLVCRHTVEERMMQRAEEKRAMQEMVIQTGTNQAANMIPGNSAISGRANEPLTSSDMVSLLLDDDELVKRLQIRRHTQNQRTRQLRNNRLPTTGVTASHASTGLDDSSPRTKSTGPSVTTLVS